MTWKFTITANSFVESRQFKQFKANSELCINLKTLNKNKK